MSRVFVAMSGGVDSSTAAALLVDAGHDVTGVTMDLWPAGEAPGGCCSVAASRDARAVCDLLGIPHYTLQFRDVFAGRVVEPFLEAYAEGRTPNPCIACNDLIKWDELLRRVKLQDAEFLATGHYARVASHDGTRKLLRGLDASKDQSYFLYRLTQGQMSQTIFPLGGLRKSEVRVLASRYGLPNAERAESQEICFVPEDDYAAVVCSARPEACEPGPIVDSLGNVLGEHSGIARFTVGQRKGLGVASAEALYVLKVVPQQRAVVVGAREELAVSEVVASEAVWHAGSGEVRCEVQIRYRGEPLPALVTASDRRLTARLDQPAYGVAPGQALVCYKGDEVLGGAAITEAR